jgi:hypothetical protein
MAEGVCRHAQGWPPRGRMPGHVGAGDQVGGHDRAYRPVGVRIRHRLIAAEGLPSSLVQLRTAGWTGDARVTRPICDMGTGVSPLSGVTRLMVSCPFGRLEIISTTEKPSFS